MTVPQPVTYGLGEEADALDVGPKTRPEEQVVHRALAAVAQHQTYAPNLRADYMLEPAEGYEPEEPEEAPAANSKVEAPDERTGA